MSELPGAGGAAFPPDVIAANGQAGLNRAANAALLREEADAVREQSLRVADEAEDQAKATLAGVKNIRKRAEDDHAAALAHADAVEQGET